MNHQNNNAEYADAANGTTESDKILSGQSSSSASTVPYSTDPATQEASDSQKDSIPTGPPAWGSLYPIDPSFYPMELYDDMITFGRGERCNYTFDVPSIKRSGHYQQYSKEHFTITRTPGSSGGHTVMLVDTSMNGVFVNGEKVPPKMPRQLCSKDEISLAFERNKVLFYYDKTEEDDPDLPQSFNEKYIMHRVIGSGAYGDVRCAISKFGTEKHAVKIINKQKTIFGTKDQERVYDDILKEAKLMLTFQHPCIIPVHDVLDSPKYLYIVLELAPGGDLYTRVLQKQWLGDSVSSIMFYQMVSAVSYLHDKNVTHRDLKPENILMMSDEEECLLKITDFGVSSLVDETSFMRTQAGTPSYLAPELVQLMKGSGKGYTKQVDCWSLGVILYVCLVGYPPFARNRPDTPQDLLQQILSANYNFKHPRWSKISDDAKDLVDSMLELDPKKRFTPHECLRHRWLNSDALMQKYKKLTRQSAVSSPACSMSIIKKIEERHIENNNGVELNLQSEEISCSSTDSNHTSLERVLKRRLSSDFSDGGHAVKKFIPGD